MIWFTEQVGLVPAILILWAIASGVCAVLWSVFWGWWRRPKRKVQMNPALGAGYGCFDHTDTESDLYAEVAGRIKALDPAWEERLPVLLDEETIAQRLRFLPHWERHGSSVRQRFLFEDYGSALRFVGQVTDLADELNHHPYLRIEYTVVTVSFTTHDAGGITEQDLESARQVDVLAASIRKAA